MKHRQMKDGYGEDRRVFAHGGCAHCCAVNRGFGRFWITVQMNSGRDCVKNICLQLILLQKKTLRSSFDYFLFNALEECGVRL